MEPLDLPVGLRVLRRGAYAADAILARELVEDAVKLRAVVRDDNGADSVAADDVLEERAGDRGADLSLMGIISGQRVSKSMTVSTCVWPSSDVMLGLQRSMCTRNHGAARRKLERMRPWAMSAVFATG